MKKALHYLSIWIKVAGSTSIAFWVIATIKYGKTHVTTPFTQFLGFLTAVTFLTVILIAYQKAKELKS